MEKCKLAQCIGAHHDAVLVHDGQDAGSRDDGLLRVLVRQLLVALSPLELNSWALELWGFWVGPVLRQRLGMGKVLLVHFCVS